ncbi:MAG: tetratricopeptide repeat protein [Planctomycetota bacterium]
MEGAPHRPEIAAILEFWANLLRVNKLPYKLVHDAARRLDPSIRAFPETIADPGEIDGISPERLTIMASRLWLEQNDLAAAERLLRAAERRHAGNYWVHLTLGGVLLFRGRHVDATRHLSVACALRPDSLEAHHRLGKVYDARAMRDEAIRAYEKALAVDPDWEHGRAHIAVSLGMERKLGEAKGLAEKVLRAKAHDYLALSVLATEAGWRGDLKETGAVYLRAAAAEPAPPNKRWLQVYGVRRLIRHGELDDAERVCREMLAATEMSPRLYGWVGYLFGLLGLEEERQQAVAKANAARR